MKLSVTIATANRAAMLRVAMEAALAQSLAPDEIVVADDASRDETPAMLGQLAAADARIKILRQARNSGGVRNWNAAMAGASGDLIAWCSDDDEFMADHLKTSVDYLEAHPEVGVVHSGFADRIEPGEGAGGRQVVFRRLRSMEPLVIRPGHAFWYLTRYYDWPFHPSTLVMRREAWEATGEFDPDYALADTDWFVRAAERCSIAYLPRYGVWNRRHPGNWSNRLGSARMQREIFEIVEKALLRRWPRRSAQRTLWRTVWRMNCRLRLLLTIRARIRGGHAEAAMDAWRALAQGTGRRLPAWVAVVGERSIKHRALRHPRSFEDARQRVSPL